MSPFLAYLLSHHLDISTLMICPQSSTFHTFDLAKIPGIGIDQYLGDLLNIRLHGTLLSTDKNFRQENGVKVIVPHHFSYPPFHLYVHTS